MDSDYNIDPAKKLFWDRIMEERNKITTKTKIILGELQEIKANVKTTKSRGRGLWQAIWHGVGVIKSEGDKLFKD